MYRILNVAEKPSIAKTIASILSNGASQRRNGISKYNACFDFQCRFGLTGIIPEQSHSMIMTSVSGHLYEMDFDPSRKMWSSCSPDELFSAKVLENVSNKDIAKCLQRESKHVNFLIIWTDCDREGEAIGWEIAQTCLKVNKNLIVKRARFSAANASDIWKAVKNLEDINTKEVQAVRTRQELDLRLGAAFTRIQTMALQKKFGDMNITSFGPCQLPTLGFVVRRYNAIKSFQQEPFWTIKMAYDEESSNGSLRCEFNWQRQRLFDEAACRALFEVCKENPTASVLNVDRKPKTKWRPLPLSTVELQIRMSKFFRMSSETTMTVAEKLYQRGIISYPRTETDSFSDTFDLRALIELQKANPIWGSYVEVLLDANGFQWPRKGKKNDEAHPPIHPTKNVPLDSLNEDERKVYEFVVRHFLACCSHDAKGKFNITIKMLDHSYTGAETNVEAHINGEIFSAKGLQILQRNYLEVYRFENWGERNLPEFTPGFEFTPSLLEIAESKTQPPELLTEVELIKLMDSHGIGTDATIQDHIKTIQNREYAVKKQNRFAPTLKGLALIKYYTEIGHEEAIARPKTRAEMESDLALISTGHKTREEVLKSTIERFQNIYRTVSSKLNVYEEIMCKLCFLYYHYHIKPAECYSSANNGNSIPGNENSFRCERKQFSICGTCGNKSLELRKFKGQKSSQPLRSLNCSVCQTIYSLPRGVPTAIEFRCPLCNFQVLSIKGAKGEYNICPKCYNSPPTADIEEFGAKMPCFKCLESECKLSQGIQGSDQVVTRCNSCETGEMTLRKTKSGKFQLKCAVKSCSGTVWLPSACKDVRIPPESPNCTSCKSSPRYLNFVMDHRKAPAGAGLNYLVCPMPDCKSRPACFNFFFDIDKQSGFNGKSSQASGASSKNASLARTSGKEKSNKQASFHLTPLADADALVSTMKNDLNLQYAGPPGNSSDKSISNIKCFGCNQYGHYKSSCPNSNTQTRQAHMRYQARKQIVCYNCGEPGHYKTSCTKGSDERKNKGVHENLKSNSSWKTKFTSETKSRTKRFCPTCGNEFGYRKRRCLICKPNSK